MDVRVKVKTKTNMEVDFKIHQTKPKTTQTRNPTAEEIQNIICISYLSTTSTFFSPKIEP